MNGAVRSELIAVPYYLSGEGRSDVRHEYIGGMVYAIAGGSEEHGLIVGNLFAALHSHLRGQGCRAFVADMKLRLLLRGEEVFYYPDILVACDPRDTDRYFKRFPKVLIEVLSDTTARIDRREKLWSYLQIETLEEYVLVAQDKREATVYRRRREWASEVIDAPTGTLGLETLEFVLPLPDIYEGIERSEP